MSSNLCRSGLGRAKLGDANCVRATATIVCATAIGFWRSLLQGAAVLLVSAAGFAAEPAERDPADTMPAGRVELDETVISGNQELPKVLYIVPWQQPDGLPEIELSTDFAETELFRRLYPPAYRRELAYFEAATASADADATSHSKASDSKE